MSSTELSATTPSLATRVSRLLNSAGLGIAVGFSITVAVMLWPNFSSSLWSLIARTVFVGLALLATFYALQAVPQRWLPAGVPRWALVLVGMVLVAPLAAFLASLWAVGGDISAFAESKARQRGFVLIAGAALVLGLVVALSALVQRGEAEARGLALRFELERKELERQALDARLSLLQAQVQPHFLFNTLANVQALVESGSPRAAEVLKSLIAYLRAAMPKLQGGPARLADEVALVQAYLELMRMRMPDRLEFSVHVEPGAAQHECPPLSLLTLAENAVRHGVDPSLSGGRIDVTARIDGPAASLVLAVADTGVGLDPKSGGGTGLANLRARLAAMYGPAARLELSENEPQGVRAEIWLPLRARD